MDIIKLGRVPKKEDLYNFYGDPGRNKLDQEWKKDNIVKCPSPFPMRLSWDEKLIARNLLINRKVAPAMIDALQEIVDYKGHEYLVKNNFDRLGGIFTWRKIRGGDSLSTHSWGISIDINPHLGPYDYPAYKSGDYENKQPDFIMEAFMKRGFISLPWDTMHFQALKI